VDLQEKHQLDMAEQVARVKARARPWRSIIALALAVAAALVSYAAGAGIPSLSQAGPHTRTVTIVAGAVLFCLFAVAATVGFSGKVREMLEPRLGSAHAAVIRYAFVLAGGLTSVIITLDLLKIGVKQLIVGGAFTAVLVSIAAQQTLSNVFAGIALLFARPFAVGDQVRMRGGALSGQLEGTVTEIGITYVRLDTDDGKLNVPNSQVLAAAVGPLRRPAPAGPSGPGGQADSPGPSAATAAAVAPLSELAAPQHSGPGGGGPDEREPQR
jgi:small-conductance mechanosensitive channel